MIFRESILFENALISARLAGRHGNDRSTTLEMLAQDGMFDAEEVKQLAEAFDEGLQTRLSGARCHCISCHSFTPQMVENEQRRGDYSRRRWIELQAEDKTFDEICKIVDEEIAGGAALQSAVTVIRSKRRT